MIIIFTFVCVLSAVAQNAFLTPSPQPSPPPPAIQEPFPANRGVAPLIAEPAANSPPTVDPLNPTADPDDIIKNDRMRAISGSKSKYSIAMSLGYGGGSVKAPFAEDRPNIGGVSGTLTKTDLSGIVAGKYNLAAQHSLLAGVGLRWVAPLSANGPQNYSGTRFDATNPYLSYQYLYNFRGLQSAVVVNGTIVTGAFQLYLGYVGLFSVSHDSLLQLGDSGFSVGMFFFAGTGLYNKSGSVGTPGTSTYIEDVKTQQNDFSFSYIPRVEYQLSQKLFLMTTVTLVNLQHLRSQSDWRTFNPAKVTQTIGLGWIVYRDVYLYPNIQFLPDDIRADRTNVGMNANINLF